MDLFTRGVVAAALIGMTAVASGQEPARMLDPRVFDLEIPPGPVSPGEQQAVTTSDADGKPVVGRIHIRVGTGAIVLLPDGQLIGRKEGDFQPTARKFEPLGQSAMAKKLAAEFPGFKTKSTNHYVYVYNSSDVFQFGTGRILESMFPGVKGWAEDCKIEVHNPAVPLVVVMFKTEAEFRRRQRTREGVVAYYEPVSNRVYMYEQSRLNEARPDLAQGQAISTIAHEGVHQILHNIGVQQRLSVWPMWLGEGLAEYFSPTTVGKNLKWNGPKHVNDLRMFELEQYVRGKAAQAPDGEMVEHTVLAAQLSSTGYATAWALVHYLANMKERDFLAYVKEASEIQPLSGAIDVSNTGVVRSNRDAFTRRFGQDLKDLEAQIVAHLRRQKWNDPFEGAPHFVATFVSGTGRRAQKEASTFHFVNVAEQWLKDLRDQLPETERSSAKAAIYPFENRAQAEAFLRHWKGNKAG
jgi:hypothetical protein